MSPIPFTPSTAITWNPSFKAYSNAATFTKLHLYFLSPFPDLFYPSFKPSPHFVPFLWHLEEFQYFNVCCAIQSHSGTLSYIHSFSVRPLHKAEIVTHEEAETNRGLGSYLSLDLVNDWIGIQAINFEIKVYILLLTFYELNQPTKLQITWAIRNHILVIIVLW